jgi:hypothetical protein
MSNPSVNANQISLTNNSSSANTSQFQPPANTSEASTLPAKMDVVPNPPSNASPNAPLGSFNSTTTQSGVNGNAISTPSAENANTNTNTPSDGTTSNDLVDMVKLVGQNRQFTNEQRKKLMDTLVDLYKGKEKGEQASKAKMDQFTTVMKRLISAMSSPDDAEAKVGQFKEAMASKDNDKLIDSLQPIIAASMGMSNTIFKDEPNVNPILDPRASATAFNNSMTVFRDTPSPAAQQQQYGMSSYNNQSQPQNYTATDPQLAQYAEEIARQFSISRQAAPVQQAVPQPQFQQPQQLYNQQATSSHGPGYVVKQPRLYEVPRLPVSNNQQQQNQWQAYQQQQMQLQQLFQQQQQKLQQQFGINPNPEGIVAASAFGNNSSSSSSSSMSISEAPVKRVGYLKHLDDDLQREWMANASEFTPENNRVSGAMYSERTRNTLKENPLDRPWDDEWSKGSVSEAKRFKK